MRRVVVGMALLVGLVATNARAQGWSAMSGQTLRERRRDGLGPGRLAGISADPAYGAEPTVDLGGRFTFNYGEEGITDTGVLGLKFQFTVRGQLVKKPKFDLALRFDPGLLLYFPSSTTVVGLTFPVGLEFGFPITPVFRANGSFDLPFWDHLQPLAGHGLHPHPVRRRGRVPGQARFRAHRTSQDGSDHRDREPDPGTPSSRSTSCVGVAYRF